MSKIAVVILNFNGNKDTLECIKSLNKLEIGTDKLFIIIVDNGSEEEFRIQNLEFVSWKLKIIRSKKNLGFAEGNNVGIKDALDQGADYILILNNDTLVDKNLVKELVNTFKKDEKIGIVSPKIYFAKGFEFHKDRYPNNKLGRVIWYAGGIMDWKNLIGFHRGVDEVDNGQYDKETETDFASGCCMAVKKEVFEKIGFFDQKYFLYYEDNDFNQRTIKKGYKIKYTPKAILWHKNAGSGGGSGSSLQDYYITRNRLLFGLTYGSLRSKAALLKESFKLFFKGRNWQKRGVIDFYLRNFGKGNYSIEN